MLLLVLLACGAAGVRAQVDPHFSQYYAYPVWLNPALTGVSQAKAKITTIFRQQWRNIPNGYSTGGLAVELSPNHRLGIGLNVVEQRSGEIGYTNFAAYGALKYSVPVAVDRWLSFGLEAGGIRQSVDFSKLRFGSQFDPVLGFDPTLPSRETNLFSTASVLDGGAGIYFEDKRDDLSVNVFGGISAAHILRAADGTAGRGTLEWMPVRYTAHAGMRYHVSTATSIVPHAIYVRDQHNDIQALGLNYELTNAYDGTITFGGMYRRNDAAVVNIGYATSSFSFGFAYDVTVSALRQANRSRGGAELVLSYKIGKDPVVVCPRF